MEIIVLTALMIFLPLIITSCVVLWRDHQAKKLEE
jgi:Na+-translocating ferredoxin:NAD+ oxidoreductase RnfE subunit